jgi:F0F1-type ATP synthase membrane subunit b/b'
MKYINIKCLLFLLPLLFITGTVLANSASELHSKIQGDSVETQAVSSVESSSAKPLAAEVKHLAKEEGSGLPQFDTSKYSQQIFWLIINFGILYLFVKYFIIRKTKDVKLNRSNVILANIEKSMKIKKNIDKTNQEINAIKSKYKIEINKSKEMLVKKVSELSKNKQDEMDKYKQEKLEEFEKQKNDYALGIDFNADIKQLSEIIIKKLNLNK